MTVRQWFDEYIALFEEKGALDCNIVDMELDENKRLWITTDLPPEAPQPVKVETPLPTKPAVAMAGAKKGIDVVDV